MEIPDKLLNKLIRHADNVVKGFDKPTAKTKDSLRLLKKDIEKVKRINNN